MTLKLKNDEILPITHQGYDTSDCGASWPMHIVCQGPSINRHRGTKFEIPRLLTGASVSLWSLTRKPLKLVGTVTSVT